MAQQTAVEWLQEKYNRRQVYEESIFDEEFEQAKAMEREHMINFYYWMKINDNEKNAESFFGFNDSDMIDQFYNEIYNK